MKHRTVKLRANFMCTAIVALLATYAVPAQSQSQWGEPVKITSGLEIGSVQFLRNGKLFVAICR